mmetsp:Transcript_44538/g.90916  ORF Transcript_44538/g.90916 Transcript_44538/m.90916 type:complete len:146 (+) Transcript_44538:48-485(+)
MWAFPGQQPPPGMPPYGMQPHPAYHGQFPYHPMPPHPAMAPAMQPEAGAGGKARRRKKKQPAGGPKKPATSFVLFSNTVREEVKAANPGLSFTDIGRKLGEMWREMDPNVRKDYEKRATDAKDRYMEEKKAWLAQRAAGGMYHEA